MYQEYRSQCRKKPWLTTPAQSLPHLIQTDFANWRRIRHRLFPSHPLFKPADDRLIDQAVDLLISGYRDTKPEFLHGHFSYLDLLQQKDQWVLFSNLFWKYKAPFYDAVFAQHWYVYHLASLNGMTSAKIKSQHQLWLRAISKLPGTVAERKLLNLALLERATAGLNLDVLSLDPRHPLTPFLFNYSRECIHKLLTQTH